MKAMRHGCWLTTIGLFLAWGSVGSAQLPPSIGYLHPAGGTIGTTTEVILGGYDWTPDMELFVLDSPVTLELLGPPGPVLIPDPPYWFGKKARRAPFPLPREFSARLGIPAGTPAGIVRWQAANANGATATGRLFVSEFPQVRETTASDRGQELPDLPIFVAGQIERIEEIDRYRFRAARSGPITCECISRALGTELNAVVRVVDESGETVAEAIDSAGRDLRFTFGVEAGRAYTVSIHDLDYRGDRSFVYQLGLQPGPRVVAALPARGQRGQMRTVEFLGFGVATGAAEWESIRQTVRFPDNDQLAVWDFRWDTPAGEPIEYRFALSDRPELTRERRFVAGEVSHSVAADGTVSENASQLIVELDLPAGITAVIDELYGEHCYRFAGRQGEHWRFTANAAVVGSPLDLSILLTNEAGEELARADDVAGGLDAEVFFTVPADGNYRIVVADRSAAGGRPDAVYRLTGERVRPGFRLSVPELLTVPIGGTAALAIQVERLGGLADPIQLEFSGLPAGVTVPLDAMIAAGQTKGTIELSVAEDAAAAASLARVQGRVDGAAEASVTEPCLIATTIRPPVVIDAEGQDDVTKWPRGTTFPGPVLIERLDEFAGPVRLEMSSRQGRHRMGIHGPEVVVPPGVSRYLYPVHLPEWLETTRTSRMVVNGVVHVADPAGNLRHVLVRQKTRMGFLPTGAVLKLAVGEPIVTLFPGQGVTVPVTISRTEALPGRLRLALEPAAGFEADELWLEPDQINAELVLRSRPLPAGEYELTLRATGWQGESFPVIARAELTVVVESP